MSENRKHVGESYRRTHKDWNMRVLDRKIRGDKGEAKGKKDGCCDTRQGTRCAI